MYFDFTVKIPKVKGKIYEKTIKDVVYINYEYDRIYKPEKKYNIPKRTTIGKRCEKDSTRMYPNANYLKFFPEAELPAEAEGTDRSSCLRVGASLVIQKIIKDYKLNDMARRTISIDEKIEKAQEDVARAKERYDSALEELKLLLEKKDEQKKAELISVIDGCGMSYDEIINLLKTKGR